MASKSNNGLVTKIWGPPSWKFLHCVTYGYPVEPTPEQKKDYKQYFELIAKILPCGACRDSYNKFIHEGDTKLNDTVMNNRNSLTKWFYKLHQKVNKKLNIDYGSTYKNVTQRYEGYRAKDKSKPTDGPQNGGGVISSFRRRAYRLVR